MPCPRAKRQSGTAPRPIGFPPLSGASDRRSVARQVVARQGRTGTDGSDGPQRVIASGRVKGHLAGMTIPPSPLEDPHNAAHAWARYKRMMRITGWITLAVIAVILAWLFSENGFVSINLYIATALGIGGTIMLTVALMGLVFLSSGTGHDEAVVDPLADD